MKRAVFLTASAMVAFSAVTSTLVAEEPTWELSYVDRPKQFTDLTDRCLRIDRDGHPHIAYGGDHLYYAWKDGDGWHYEIAVDHPPTLGSHAAMALDESGFPHISYYRLNYSTHGELKYAYKDESGWHDQTVDANDGTFTSLALDSCGRAHVSYYDDEGKRLMYAHRNTAGTWAIEVVDDRPYIVGRYSSLALDASGNPHIAYPHENIWWDLEYAYKDSAGWNIETVDAEGYAGLYASLALDQEARPHISYYSSSDGLHNEKLAYAHKDQSGWHVETADGHGGVGTHTSIAIDNDGVPHISYRSGYGGPDSELRYARRDSAGWYHQTVDTDSSHGYYSSIDVHSDDTIHIAFCAGGDIIPGDLKYALRQGDTWTIDLVDRQGMAGYDATSIALDGSGTPYVSYFTCARYYPNREYAVTFAQHHEDGWHAETIDEDVHQPGSVSLAVAGSATPYLAYSSRNRGVKCAHRTSTTWVIEAVDPSGEDVSLALSSNGSPHIAFALGYTSIGYASKEGDSWSTEIIDVDDRWAASVSLALDHADSPHLAYHEKRSYSYDLQYAWRTATGWRTEKVDDSGYDPSIVIDGEGFPHIAYVGSGGFRHAYRDSGGWHTESIGDSGAENAWDISIALDSRDFPHISYHHDTTGHLKHAYKDGWGWHVQTVDGGWEIGRGSDLALSSTGEAYISYCHTPNRDVKYAHAVFEAPAPPDVPSSDWLELTVLGPSPSEGSLTLLLTLLWPAHAEVGAYDLSGRRVTWISRGHYFDGVYPLLWDGLDDRGLRVPSGTYVCSAEAGGARTSTRVVLIR